MQNQSKFFQALATLGGLGAAAWLLVNLAPVLSPFILAAVLAYALAPAVDALAAKRIPRWVGAGLAVCLVMLFMLALLFLVVPVVTKQIPLIREQVPALLTHLNQWIRPLAAHWGLDLAIDVEQVRQSLYALLSSHDQDLLKSLFGTLQSGGSALLTIVGNGVLMPIVAVYLLLDYRRVTEGVFGLVPPRWQSATGSFLHDVDVVLGRYLRGQALVMLALASFYIAALAAIGLDLAFPIGLFTGVVVFIPFLGFGLGLLMALFAAALEFQSVTGVLAVAGVYAVGQVVESMWLTPKFLGDQIGLSPIAVIFSLMAFGQLFGFVGVLVALPASAVLLVAIQRVRAQYETSDFYLQSDSDQHP